jgi:hypothetical protein
VNQVGRDLPKLHFRAQHTERVYLNEERAHDRFTSLFGAIATWVSKATKEGSVSLPIIPLGAAVGSENAVTYDITNPVAQALLIRAALEDKRLVRPLDAAEPLEYVVVRGESCLRHPAVIPRLKWHTEACTPTDELEGMRADAELVHRAFNRRASVWLLMILRDDGGRAAAVVDQKWLNDQAIPRFFHKSWTTFGVLQDRVGDVPLIAPISVFIDYPHARERSRQTR